jgi:hypothetical protein
LTKHARGPGEPPALPAGPVWTAHRDRRGDVGRFHTRPTCWALLDPKPKRLAVREWPDAVAAHADGWYSCPYCAAPPTCCAEGQHAALALPQLAPADIPEWEEELAQTEEEA